MRALEIHYMDASAGEVVISRHVRDNIYSIYERRKSKALADNKPFVEVVYELFYDLAEEQRNCGGLPI